jgi:DNA invertase Pin-like site-specific DNA recombinase
MRAIIYARVSTEEQRLFGYSLDAQIKVCREYCERRGWDVVLVYREAVSSKKEDKRTEFQRAITFLKEGGADVLVAWKLDRISRSNFEFQKLLREVGYKFATVQDNLDLTDENKKLEADIRIAFAEEERRNISIRTKLGLERARAQGKRIGRPPKIPDEVKKKIIHLRKRGFTYREIAERTGVKENTVKTICYRAGV